MFETHFESLEALHSAFSSHEIMGMVQKVMDFSNGTMGVYLVDGETFKSSVQKSTEFYEHN